MDIEELQLQLAKGEGLTIEFKKRFSSKLDKDLVAFANTDGGRIFLGVDDHGKIIGETLTNELKAKINSLVRNCEPGITLKSIEQIGKVIVISIEESREKPHGCSTGYFRRLDASTQKMNQKELKLLFHTSDHKPRFEELVNDEITWDDISVSKIQAFLLQASIQMGNVDPQKLLASLRLAREGKINNAGVLFFAKEPRDFLLQCEMILVAYKGTSGVQIYDRINIQDDLITQFKQAMIFIRKHLNVRSEIKSVDRYDICEIPFVALREAVANAVIHRDYSLRGTSLIVEVHEDRVVIKNPGGLPEGVSLNALTQISIRRNETIADMFSRIDRAERVGSGIRRIMELISEAKLPKPVIESDAFFRITFKRDPKFKVGGISSEAGEIVRDELNTRQTEILHVLGSKKLAPNEIMELLGNPVTDRSLRRDLQFLQEKGYVDFEGSAGWERRWFLTKK